MTPQHGSLACRSSIQALYTYLSSIAGLDSAKAEFSAKEGLFDLGRTGF